MLIVFFLATAFAQDKPAKFTVQVSTDSVLMGNYFEVKFILENASSQNFEAPDFNDHFKVVSGPNFSSSMSLLNGNLSQSTTITFYLEPKDPGLFYILPASVKAGDKVLETAPQEVLVVPNPDGIIQQPPRKTDPFQFEWGDPFDMDLNFDFLLPELRPSPSPPGEDAPKETQKKKRKTIRI